MYALPLLLALLLVVWCLQYFSTEENMVPVSKDLPLFYKIQEPKVEQLDQQFPRIESVDDVVSLMHIPKTGVTTLHHSIVALRNPNSTEFLNVTFAFNSPGKDEYCLQDLRGLRGRNNIGTLFRSPIHHIYSQYLECKFDEWGLKTTKGRDFPREKENEMTGYMPAFEKWLKHFVQEVESIKNGTFDSESNDYNCYHPYNMQTRYLFCDSSLQTKWKPLQVGHHFDQVHQNQLISEKEIAEAIRNLWFVGILEHFDLSVCLFKYQINGKLPQSCRCDHNQINRQSTVLRETKIERHNVPPHPISVLNTTLIKMIRDLSQADEYAYRFAVKEFFKRVKKVEEALGKSLSCLS